MLWFGGAWSSNATASPSLEPWEERTCSAPPQSAGSCHNVWPELRNQIDGIWNDLWSGGLANPLQVIEQITYLIFIKRLDEMQEPKFAT